MPKILSVVGHGNEQMKEVSINVAEKTSKIISGVVSVIAQAAIGTVGALLQTAKAIIRIPLTFLVTILGMDDKKLENFSLKGIVKDFIMIGLLVDHVARSMFDTLCGGGEESSVGKTMEYVYETLIGTNSSYQALDKLFSPTLIPIPVETVHQS